MRIRVLGSAAGGGFPQWNCNCRNCAGVRSGATHTRPRTQSSIAVTGKTSAAWALVNASPDILSQLQTNSLLQPARAIRDTAITAIVLVDGQIDHTTGLLMLREATRPWPLWCTDSVYADLTRGNPILEVLSHYCGVDRRRIDLDGEGFSVDGVAGVRWRGLPVASKPAPYSPNRESPVPGDNVALLISCEDTGKSALYAPGLGAMEEHVWKAMQEVDCVLVDGTFWTDDEMIRLGLSAKRARQIGHMQLPRATRKILIHINNTNPILEETSPERAQLRRLGIDVAWDGMEIVL